MTKLDLLGLTLGASLVHGCSSDEATCEDVECSEDDTDDGTASVTADVVPDNGVPPYTLTFTGSSIRGGFIDTAWNFTATHSDLTLLTFAFAGAPDVASHTVGQGAA